MKNYTLVLLVLLSSFFTNVSTLQAKALDLIPIKDCKSVIKLNAKQLGDLTELLCLYESDEQLSGALRELIDQQADDAENAMFVFAMGTIGTIFVLTLTGMAVVRVIHDCIERRAVWAINGGDEEDPPA